MYSDSEQPEQGNAFDIMQFLFMAEAELTS
jgi:hypothetical protein